MFGIGDGLDVGSRKAVKHIVFVFLELVMGWMLVTEVQVKRRSTLRVSWSKSIFRWLSRCLGKLSLVPSVAGAVFGISNGL